MKKLMLLFHVFSLLALPSNSFSQDRKSYSWMLEGAGLLCKVHDSGCYGIAFRAHRLRIAGGYLGVETGILGCIGGETGFLSLDIGFRLRPIPNGRFSPFVGVGSGLGSCGEWGGSIKRGYLGIEAMISSRSIITATYQIGSHGGDQGPSFFAIGLAWFP